MLSRAQSLKAKPPRGKKESLRYQFCPGLDPPIDEANNPTGDVDGLQETVGKAEVKEGEHAVRDETSGWLVETRRRVKQESQVGFEEHALGMISIT